MRICIGNSGGIDSACLAKYGKDQGHEVFSVYIDVPCDNRESAMEASAETASKFCDYHHIVTLDYGFPANYEEGGLKKNGLSTRVCASILQWVAKQLDCDEVWMGTKGNVTDTYEEVFNSLDDQNIHQIAHVPVKFPFACANLGTYQEVMDWCGVTNVEDIQETVSCRDEVPCGVCPDKCLKRAELGV